VKRVALLWLTTILQTMILQIMILQIMYWRNNDEA